MIQLFAMENYGEAYQLWKKTPGIGLRSLDDSREGIEKFLRRNPNTNFVAVEDGHLVGVALSGHDGRRGYLYHVCVEEAYRHKSIGKQLIGHVSEAMKAEGITKLAFVCMAANELGNQFWNSRGFEKRDDLNYYTFSIDSRNK